VIDLRVRSVSAGHALAPAELAATLRRRCGHALATSELVDELGYRFHALPNAELPPFFNRRLRIDERRGAAITLLAGIHAETGREALEGCRTTADARRELALGPAGVWLVHVTLGNVNVGWSELTGELARSDPPAFSAIGGHLIALSLNRRPTCTACGDRL
jgi:hypothetical protein